MVVLQVILRKHLLGQGEALKFIILGKPDRDLSCKEDKKIVLPIPSLLPSWHVHFPGEGSHRNGGSPFSGCSGWDPHSPVCSPAGGECKTLLWLGRGTQVML